MVRTFRRQTLRRQCRTFRRHIQLHKDRIPRHRHPRDPREDVGEDVGVVECGLYAIVCVGETSDIVGVTSVGETSVLRSCYVHKLLFNRRIKVNYMATDRQSRALLPAAENTSSPTTVCSDKVALYLQVPQSAIR